MLKCSMLLKRKVRCIRAHTISGGVMTEGEVIRIMQINSDDKNTFKGTDGCWHRRLDFKVSKPVRRRKNV